MNIQFNTISLYNPNNMNSSIRFEKSELPPFARKYANNMKKGIRNFVLEMQGEDELPQGLRLKPTFEPSKKLNYSKNSRFYR